MASEKLLKLGAEARLTVKVVKGPGDQGTKGPSEVLVKHRIKKGYRLAEIDEPLRTQRTARESSLMEAARRAKVNVPKIFNVDKKSATIEMELIDGKRIDLCLTPEHVEKTGEGVGRLHEAGIIHGDLTTSNILVKGAQGHSETGAQIYFIDFGLGEFSTSVEKRGVDIRVFKESINATKPAQMEELMKAFWKGYKKECKGADEVIKRLGGIELRGRYKERGGVKAVRRGGEAKEKIK